MVTIGAKLILMSEWEEYSFLCILCSRLGAVCFVYLGVSAREGMRDEVEMERRNEICSNL